MEIVSNKKQWPSKRKVLNAGKEIDQPKIYYHYVIPSPPNASSHLLLGKNEIS